MNDGLPLGGLNDNEAYGSQPAGTSRRLVNVRAIDPTDGTRRLSQRAGMTKYCPTQLSGANKVKHLASVATDRAKVTYTSLGDAVTVAWQTTTPALAECKNIRTDRQGNVYALNGRVGVVKYNATGTQLWTLTLPTTDTGHECRALFVDDQDNVYVAVSTGGSQAKAKMWCYVQEAENKTRLLWELSDTSDPRLGAYVEEIKIKSGKLYTLQNRPDRGAAEVVVYENFTVPTPTETQRFNTAGDANGMDPGIDGSVFVCAQPNSQRGLDPLAPDASPKARDWDPTMLTKWGERAWAWVKAESVDDFNVTPVSGAPDEDGGSITAWYDRTGNGRHLYGAGSLSIASRTNPVLKLRGSSGRPSVFFNGTSAKMISLGNANTTDPFQQRSFLPGYAGAMYVIVGVGRMTTGTTDRRWVFGIQTAGGSQKFFLNVDASNAFAQPADTGSCAWYESQTTTNASGVGTKPNNYPFTSLHPWAPVSPTGARNLPNGYFIFSIAFTNGQSGFESWVRINGNPVDVWTSTSDTWTDGFQLGEVTTVSTGTSKDPSGSYDFFPGEIMEMLVLRDYRTALGSLSLIEVNGTGGSVYPNANFAGIPNLENTEIQKLEGYMAGEWGCSHVLPGGTAARLQFSGNAADGDTVTIGATTYRFKTVMAAVNDVQLGGSAAASALALIKAINLTGTSGTDYFAGTAINASMWAFPQRFNEDADATPAIMLRSLTKSSTAITTTETGANLAFTATTSQTSLAPTAGENDGFYPHPFTDVRVINGSAQIISTGGPPRQSDSDYSLPSKAALLNSPYGLLVKHAESGRPRWVATSGVASPTTGLGGVGYGCIVNSVGDVYSMGPRHTTVGTDNIDVRKIIDQGDTFSTTNGSSATTAWSDDPGAQTYHYPRMAVDKFDNVFVPMSVSGTTLIAYAKLGNGAGSPDNANEIATITTITSDPSARAVALDPNVPEYPSTFTDTRPEYIYLGTELTTTTNYAVYRIKLVASVSRTGTPRQQKYVGIAQGDFVSFTSAAVVAVTGGAGFFDALAEYYSSAVINRKLYITNGVVYGVYDPNTNTIAAFTATSSGSIPLRNQLFAAWRNRLVIGRDPDSPSNWAMSAVRQPDNWDFFPPNAPIATMAIKGSNSIPGTPSDIINSIMPWSDDRMVIGGDHSLRIFAGDPAAGGQIIGVSETTGSGFGQHCFCKDPSGTLYFWESKGGVQRWTVGGGPVSITDGRIERRMRDIDFSAYYMALVWDSRRFGLHVYQMPFGAHSGTIKAWFWDSKSDAWFEDEYTGNARPTAAHVIDGDTFADRALLLGCPDGYVRQYSDSAFTDDGILIAPVARCGPWTYPGRQVQTDELQATIGSTQGSCQVAGYMSSTPENTGNMVRVGRLYPGKNIVPMRLCGEALWVELSNISQGTPGSRFAIDSIVVPVQDGGPSRHG